MQYEDYMHELFPKGYVKPVIVNGTCEMSGVFILLKESSLQNQVYHDNEKDLKHHSIGRDDQFLDKKNAW